MLFRVNWKISEEYWHEVVQRFVSMADNPNYDLPDGLTLVGRWHNTAGRDGTQIFKTDDIMLLHQWLMNWNDRLTFEVDAVVEDEEAGALCIEMMSRVKS